MVKRKRSKCHGNSCKRNKSQLSPAILFQKQSKIEKQKIVVKCERHLQNTLEKLRKTAFSCENSRFSLVRVGRLELPTSCSQSKRATNCATPGYEVFQLWSNMWSTPIFDQLPARVKVLSAQVSQGFPGFPRTVARTRASRSQKRHIANYTNPRGKISVWFFIIIYLCWDCKCLILYDMILFTR